LLPLLSVEVVVDSNIGGDRAKGMYA
jgi:hypothetical protein